MFVFQTLKEWWNREKHINWLKSFAKLDDYDLCFVWIEGRLSFEGLYQVFYYGFEPFLLSRDGRNDLD